MSVVVPDDADLIRQMPSNLLYQLEEAGRLATSILDERVIAWTGEGWTQQRIADELGCARTTVLNRQQRLAVVPSSPRGAPRKELSTADNSEPEVVDAEPVAPKVVKTKRAEAAGDLPAHYLPDVLNAAPSLREEVVTLCEQAARIKEMRASRSPLEPQYEGDREELMHGLEMVADVARSLRKALSAKA